jgi:hypothetical protein
VIFYNRPGLDGIVNGGHQYRSALDNKDALVRLADSEEANLRQYMPFHAIVGLKRACVGYIAKALNTNVQVTDAALLYSMGVFDSIESVLKEAGIADHFGKKGYEKEVSKLAYDISDNVVLMEAFNRHQYHDGTRHGTYCTSNKGNVIKNYGRPATRKAFKGMVHLLPEFWTLFETVQRTGWDLISMDKPADKVSWVKGPNLYYNGMKKPGAKGKTYKFPITEHTGNTQLIRSLTLCIMAAFRQFLILEANNHYRWERPFSKILDIWYNAGGEMLDLANKKTEEAAGKASDVFKTDSSGVWTSMYQILSKY